MLDWDELAVKAQKGDKQALDILIKSIYKYVKVALGRQKRYNEDVLQEIMLEVFRDLPKYKPDKARYKTYLLYTLNTTFYSNVRALRCEKRMINNDALSLDYKVGDDEDTLYDIYDNGIEDNVMDLMIANEMLDKLEKALTDLERDTLRLEIQGYSLKESCKVLGRHYKAIDNARERIKRKAKKIFELKVGA